MARKNLLKYIRSLDLRYLVDCLVQRHNWDLLEAQDVVRKYKNFLLLIALYPGLNAVPTAEIDVVWHEHILHTRQYMDDCDRMFGRYLHHRPSSDSEEEKRGLEKAYAETMRLYETEFKESYGYCLDIENYTNVGA